jgi:hypothetical protein
VNNSPPPNGWIRTKISFTGSAGLRRPLEQALPTIQRYDGYSFLPCV